MFEEVESGFQVVVEGVFVFVEEQVAGGASVVEGVEINTYSVIYDAMDDIKAAMEGMLDKVKKEVSTGQVEVKEVFKISKVGAVATCEKKKGCSPQSR